MKYAYLVIVERRSAHYIPLVFQILKLTMQKNLTTTQDYSKYIARCIGVFLEDTKILEVLFRHVSYFKEPEWTFNLTIHFYKYERLQARLNGPSSMEFRTKAA